MSDALTVDEANALLRAKPAEYRSGESLRALAARVDADAPGRITSLYSGPAARGTWSTDVVRAMMEMGDDIRVINRSEAAKFLESRGFLRRARRRVRSRC